MSNIGFLHLKPKVQLKDLQKDIQQISKERFDGKVNCKFYNSKKVVKDWGNSILVIDYNKHHIVTLVYGREKALEWNHSMDMFATYVETTIKHILSEKYNAFIGDEGIGDEVYKGKDRKEKDFYEFVLGFKERMGAKNSWLAKRRLRQFVNETMDFVNTKGDLE